MDGALLKFLQDWLLENNRETVSSNQNGLIMVVAGSFHIKEGDEIYNTSTIFNHRGDVLWYQRKRCPFSFDREDIGNNPGLKTILKTSDAGGYERIKTRDKFKFYCLDTV